MRSNILNHKFFYLYFFPLGFLLCSIGDSGERTPAGMFFDFLCGVLLSRNFTMLPWAVDVLAFWAVTFLAAVYLSTCSSLWWTVRCLCTGRVNWCVGLLSDGVFPSRLIIVQSVSIILLICLLSYLAGFLLSSRFPRVIRVKRVRAVGTYVTWFKTFSTDYVILAFNAAMTLFQTLSTLLPVVRLTPVLNHSPVFAYWHYSWEWSSHINHC